MWKWIFLFSICRVSLPKVWCSWSLTGETKLARKWGKSATGKCFKISYSIVILLMIEESPDFLCLCSGASCSQTNYVFWLSICPIFINANSQEYFEIGQKSRPQGPHMLAIMHCDTELVALILGVHLETANFINLLCCRVEPGFEACMF